MRNSKCFVVWKSAIAGMGTLQKTILRRDVILQMWLELCKKDENALCVQTRKKWAKIAVDLDLTLGVSF